MAVRQQGRRDFSGCPECEPDFYDLVEILDEHDDDDIEDELHDWGYTFTTSASHVSIVLPCKGTVELEWTRNPGTIISAGCAP
jgi:hypothetical protein